jgi:hypothetical protein
MIHSVTCFPHAGTAEAIETSKGTQQWNCALEVKVKGKVPVFNYAMKAYGE